MKSKDWRKVHCGIGCLPREYLLATIILGSIETDIKTIVQGLISRGYIKSDQTTDTPSSKKLYRTIYAQKQFKGISKAQNIT